MTSGIRLSDPIICGERTIIPLIRDSTLVSEYGCLVARDPVGLIIMEHNKAWFVSLSEEITLMTIDDLLGITE